MAYIIRNKKTGKIIIKTESFFNASYWYRNFSSKENYEFVKVKIKSSAI